MYLRHANIDFWSRFPNRLHAAAMSQELESAQQTVALGQDAETLSRMCAVDTYLSTFASPPKSATELRDYRIVLLAIGQQRPTRGRNMF